MSTSFVQISVLTGGRLVFSCLRCWQADHHLMLWAVMRTQTRAQKITSFKVTGCNKYILSCLSINLCLLHVCDVSFYLYLWQVDGEILASRCQSLLANTSDWTFGKGTSCKLQTLEVCPKSNVRRRRDWHRKASEIRAVYSTELPAFVLTAIVLLSCKKINVVDFCIYKINDPFLPARMRSVVWGMHVPHGYTEGIA